MKVFVVDDDCVVCLERAPISIFRPCGHKCCCNECTDEIRAANMACPLCRTVIDGVLEYQLDDCDQVESVAPSVISAFDREEYVQRLRRSHTSNAAFAGKSKFARSVSRAIGNELEEREMQTQGSERMMSKSVSISAVNDTLQVNYKVGRKTRCESYPLWPSLEEISEEAKTHDDALELASFYPELYWNLYHWTNGKVHSIFESKKRRK